MNTHESFHRKNRRKTEQGNTAKIKLNISKIKQSKLKYSISPRKKRKSDDRNIPTNFSNLYNFANNRRKLNDKRISMQSISSKRNSYYIPFKNANIEYNNEKTKRHSLELGLAKTNKFYQKYNLKKNGDISMNEKESAGNYIKPIKLNIIENNIKNVLNNMRLEIEKKQAKLSSRESNIIPDISKNKLTSSPNLKFCFINKRVKISKKKNLQTSLLMQKATLEDLSFKKISKKKRNRSFDYSENFKKRLIKKLKNEIIKKYNEKISNKNNNSVDEDDTDNNEIYKGKSFLPTSKYILIFDLLLIISDLYTFVFVPLRVAQNNDIREKEPIIKEIIHYIIDVVFLLDFFISLFRGYYNYYL